MESQDKLEKFIAKHRNEFDTHSPSDQLWGKIEGGINKQRSTNLTSSLYLWKAAAATLFIACSWLVYNNFNTEIHKPNSFNAEYITTEEYFSTIIDEKAGQIKVYQDQYPELGADFLSDLDKLNNKYSELKNEYLRNNSQQVINAMIQNLQLRSRLLDQQLEIIKNINRKDETIKI